MEVKDIRFIRIKDDIFNLREVICIFKYNTSDIGIDYKNGDGRIIEFDTPEERDEEFERIEKIL